MCGLVPHWRRSPSDVSPHAHCALRQADPRGRLAVACIRSLGAVDNTLGMRRRPVNLAVVAGTREPARTAHKLQTGPGANVQQPAGRTVLRCLRNLRKLFDAFRGPAFASLDSLGRIECPTMRRPERRRSRSSIAFLLPGNGLTRLLCLQRLHSMSGGSADMHCSLMDMHLHLSCTVLKQEKQTKS